MAAPLAHARSFGISGSEDLSLKVEENIKKGELLKAFALTERKRQNLVAELAEANALQVQVASKIFAQRDPAALFITTDYKPTDFLVELLQLDDLYDPSDSFSKMTDKTQKKWLQTVQGKSAQGVAPTKGSVERTDLKDSSDQISLREKVERIARSMQLFDKREAALSHYKYGAWLGAFLIGVRNNLNNLVKAWNEGIRFDNLVVFTGERYLRKEAGQEDDIAKLCDPSQSPLPFKKDWKLPEGVKYDTEYDMMKLVFDQVELPEDMAKALLGKVTFVNALKGTNLRPGTKDCYITWLKNNPEPGTIFAVSYPLLWSAQQIAGTTLLGDSYPLDTTAPALSAEEYERRKPAVVSLVHDTVTKCLFEINNRLKAQKAPQPSKIVPFPKDETKKQSIGSGSKG